MYYKAQTYPSVTLLATMCMKVIKIDLIMGQTSLPKNTPIDCRHDYRIFPVFPCMETFTYTYHGQSACTHTHRRNGAKRSRPK